MQKRLYLPASLFVAASVLFVVGVTIVLRATHATPAADASATKPGEPAAAQEAAGKKELIPEIKLARSVIDHVTVHPQHAVVTRLVEVPQGTGTLELVVSPLPARTGDTSLFSEGADGVRVLTTRFRVRSIKEDTRDEIRKVESELKQRGENAEKLTADIQALEENLRSITRLDGFAATSATAGTDKGKLDADQVTNLAQFVMKQREDKTREWVTLKQKVRDNAGQMEFLNRQLKELSAGTVKVERDAVIVVHKTQAAPSQIKLNYVVDVVGWRPHYRFRAGKDENDPIRIEYLAGVAQQTGEDWNNVKITLSTAQPRLNAASPQLRALAVTLVDRDGIPTVGGPLSPFSPFGQLGQQGQSIQLGAVGGQLGVGGGQLGVGGGQAGMPLGGDLQQAVLKELQKLRQQAEEQFSNRNSEEGTRLSNEAGALEQTNEILLLEKENLRAHRSSVLAAAGHSVSHPLVTRLSVPSRHEEHVIEVAQLKLAGDFCYKAVPLLSRHVHRQANLTNTTDYVLLPGEATMYNGDDFVGRMDVPLVAIGEQFTAGFGVDPQLQVVREMLDKQRTEQGGNQVFKYDYRILVSSYKTKPVKVQLWERLPRSERETFGVTVLKTTPELCKDALYERESKPHNLLRWDVVVKPGMQGEKALPVEYQFRVELDKNLVIGGFQTK